VFTLAAALAPAAFAASSTAAAQAAKLVSAVTHGSVHLVSTFLGPASNIIGFIDEDKAGKKVMAWVVDSHFLVAGPLFSKTGENLSQALIKKHEVNIVPWGRAAGVVPEWQIA